MVLIHALKSKKKSFCFYFSYLIKHAAITEGKLRFLRSRWGGKLLILNKYLFSSNKRKQIGSTVKIWWRCTYCSKRKTNPCHARCITKNNEIIKISSPNHNHPPQLSSTKKDDKKK